MPVRAAIVVGLLALSAMAQGRKEGRNQINVRGQIQDVYFFRTTGAAEVCRSVLFLPGDGGWRGFAIVIAQTMASWGYDTYAWDTKRYLESFTGKKPLTESDVMSDFHRSGNGFGNNAGNPSPL